jgi:nicotinamidase-related amidase
MEIRNKAALITIDVQKGVHDPFWGKRNNPECEKNIETLLGFWRKKGWPVFHVQHASTNSRSPLRPDSEGFSLMDFIKPLDSESISTKNVNSAFIGTELEVTLREAGIEALVFCGFVTDHCVSTSCRMAANLGFQCSVVSDATATFDRISSSGQIIPANLVHEINLASLSQEFAEIVSTQFFTR